MKKFIFFLPIILLLISCNNKKEGDQKEQNNLSEIESANQASQEEIEAKQAHEYAIKTSKENPYKDANIVVHIFKNDTVKPASEYKGYGYNILINEALTVHQPHKPGVPGTVGFKSESDAKKAGDFIVYKIRNNILPPTVSMRELDSLGLLK